MLKVYFMFVSIREFELILSAYITFSPMNQRSILCGVLASHQQGTGEVRNRLE